MDLENTVIKVDRVGKKYRMLESLRKNSGSWYQKPLQNLKDIIGLLHFSDNENEANIFWALRDISFEIKAGESVGIVGANGAGKSTLLKLLSRITGPSTGNIALTGKVSSLLEVGTGFNPQLTGRENVYMNGTLLGMRRHEIDQKLPEIIEFAGIGDHLDMPVKRYSSGMRVRLGFAVASFLDQDILIVDEVLAVGDASFRKRSSDRMRSMIGDGSTLLFVSHNMGLIESLCERVIVIEKGQLVYDGPTAAGVNRYLQGKDDSEDKGNSEVSLVDHPGRKTWFHPLVKLEKFAIRDTSGEICDVMVSGETYDLVIHYKQVGEFSLRDSEFRITIKNMSDEVLATLSDRLSSDPVSEIGDIGTRVCRLENLSLAPGRYWVNVNCIINGNHSDAVRDVCKISVVNGDFYPGGITPHYDTRGVFYHTQKWR